LFNRSKQTVVLFPGGAEEPLATEQGKYNLVSADRQLLIIRTQQSVVHCAQADGGVQSWASTIW
jgi:hypothetical protein